LADLDLRPELAIDAEVRAAGLDWNLHSALEELAPFGEGNRRPLLVVRGATAAEPKIVGESHLSFQMAGAGDRVRAIAFRQGYRLEEVVAQPVDIVATLESDSWKGNARLELKVKDIAPVAALES
jgi:single-stranded-DNA-specific exonuclease